MTGRRRPSIQLRKLIYIGCEGASEREYARILQNMARDAKLPVTFLLDTLTGDPVSRIQAAVRRIHNLARTRVAPAHCFVLLDTDQVQRVPDRAALANAEAIANNITIVWQVPCFEAFLLRHFDGRSHHRPPDNKIALDELRRLVPSYEKAMRAEMLEEHIDRSALERAAEVEPELKSLLLAIGLL